MIHMTYKISVNRLFILLERLSVNSRRSVIKFGVSNVIWLYADALLCKGGRAPALFKGQLTFLDHPQNYLVEFLMFESLGLPSRLPICPFIFCIPLSF